MADVTGMQDRIRLTTDVAWGLCVFEMSAVEIEKEIRKLEPDELRKLSAWFADFATKQAETSAEDAEWHAFALATFASFYDDEELEYSLQDIKR
jgi:proline racemase